MKEKLKNILLESRKKGNKSLSGNMQILMSDIQKDEIAKQRELTDSELFAHIRKAIKNSEEAITVSKSESVKANESEYQELLTQFLPKKLSVTEITDLLIAADASKDDNDGKLMGLIMKSHRDVVDPQDVRAAIVKFKEK